MTQKIAKKLPSGHHGTILSDYIFAIQAHIDNRKKIVKQKYLPTCSHNMVNFGPLMAEICWRLWGTPANFNGFRVMASSLQRCRSTEANQTFHDVWPSPGLVHCIGLYMGALAP